MHTYWAIIKNTENYNNYEYVRDKNNEIVVSHDFTLAENLSNEINARCNEYWQPKQVFGSRFYNINFIVCGRVFYNEFNMAAHYARTLVLNKERKRASIFEVPSSILNKEYIMQKLDKGFVHLSYSLEKDKDTNEEKIKLTYY